MTSQTQRTVYSGGVLGCATELVYRRCTWAGWPGQCTGWSRDVPTRHQVVQGRPYAAPGGPGVSLVYPGGPGRPCAAPGGQGRPCAAPGGPGAAGASLLVPGAAGASLLVPGAGQEAQE